jgi:outer membrane protein
MKRYLLTAIIATAAAAYLANPAMAQTRKLDIMDAYALALERDAAHASDKAALDAGLEKAEQGAAALAPLIQLDGSAGYTDQDITYKGTNLLKGGRANYPGGAVSLTLVQPLFRPQNWAIYKQGQAASELAKSAYELSGQDLVQRVAVAYFNVLLARHSMENIAAQKGAIYERLARAKKSFEVGSASITDTHEAQARYDLVVSREIMAVQGLQIAGEDLAKITGEASFELTPLREEFTPASPSPNEIDKWAGEAEKNNPYLEMKRKALDIAMRERERAQGARLPVADLTANYTYANQGGSNFGVGMESASQSVNLKLSLPLYTGGALSSKVREATANEEKARYDLEEARRQVRLGARSAFLRVQSAQAEVNALDQARISSLSALTSTQQGYEVGLRNAVDVLDAQQLFFDAKQGLAQAKYNYLLSLLRLEAAAGTLSGEGLRRVSGYLAAR